MIRLHTLIKGQNDSFQEISYNNQVIGSIYQSENNPKIYQCLVPNLEFYKKKYNWYGEQDGAMFVYFDRINDLLKFKRINKEIDNGN